MLIQTKSFDQYLCAGTAYRSLVRAGLLVVLAAFLGLATACPVAAQMDILERPATVALQANGSTTLYGFVTDSTGNLAANRAGKWLTTIPKLFTAVRNPSAIVFQGGIYVFVTGADGNLHCCYSFSNGATWTWANFASAAPGTYVQFPAAITDGKTISVFVSDLNGVLWCAYWNGQGWHWINTEGVLDIPFRPTATTVSYGGQQHIDCFGTAQNGQVERSYWVVQPGLWNGGSLFSPPGQTVWNPEATTYFDGVVQHHHVFGSGTDGNLWVLYNNTGTANGWFWTSLGRPTNLVGQLVDVGVPGPVTYFDGTRQRFEVYTAGTDGTLYCKYWDSSGWHWTSLGRPLTGTGVYNPVAVTYVNALGRHDAVYVHGDDGNLYLWLSGVLGSSWTNLGLP